VTATFPGRPIVLIGHSAGAHIASLLALDKRYLSALPPPVAFVGISGPYAFDPASWSMTRSIFVGDKSANARPMNFVAPGAPPMLLIQGTDDRPVKLWNLTMLANAVRAVGLPVETGISVPWLGASPALAHPDFRTPLRVPG
jgi:acetyl esterase/lipase